jgi:aryl-alcohol dehydrogenase-like predicted oxidoreductase
MRQIAIGNSSLQVGVIAYGCWRFAKSEKAEAAAKINSALDHGLNLIDTADIYGFGEPRDFGGAEQVLGEVLQDDKSLRERMVLATKGGIIPPRPYNSSYDYLMGAMDSSLRRLKTDMVDIYQIHRPDLMVPMAETARALNDMVTYGKARYIGVSNFTVSQTRALQAHLDAPLVTTQPEFSALQQNPITDGTLDWCSETSATALAWSPLAGGALATGETNHPRGTEIIDTLDRLANKHGKTRSQIALAFTLHHGAEVIPIIGTQNTTRIAESAQASHIQLEARDFYDLIEAYRGVAMP